MSTATIANAQVREKFSSYPPKPRKKLHALRKLILTSASELGQDAPLENLKWGEPTYTSKEGSPLRMDWKEKAPDQYALYFNCYTSLVATIREIYGPVFSYEGKRALLFDLHNDELPVEALKHCIRLALRYKKLRHLPLLGA